jgi:hypothetical protein
VKKQVPWIRLGRQLLICMLQEREAASSAQGQQWHSSHAREDPLFFETLEASIRHTWVDKSRCVPETLWNGRVLNSLAQLLQGGVRARCVCVWRGWTQPCWPRWTSASR